MYVSLEKFKGVYFLVFASFCFFFSPFLDQLILYFGGLIHFRMGAASVMMGDGCYKFGQSRSERNDLMLMAMEEKAKEEKAKSASRQIYLTFPADITFKDEDVSNYFR